MQTNPIFPLTFGYSHPLKTAYKKGFLPNVKRDVFGHELTLKNVSLDHIQPVSCGGKTSLDNITLMTKKNNNSRGITPLEKMITIQQLRDYLLQFIGINNKYVNGNEYIKAIQKRFNIEV